MADIFDTIGQEERPKDIFDQVEEPSPEPSTPSIGQIASNAGQAAIETASGLIPKTLGQVGELAVGTFAPAVQAVRDIGTTGQSLYDVLFGGKSIEETNVANRPEATTLAEVDKTPAYSRERFKAGFDVLAQMGMAAAVGRGLQPKPGLHEVLTGERVEPEIPTAATEIAASPLVEQVNKGLKEGEINASEITSPESVTQPEVRPPVGEEPPLRQQGETPEARQGTETQPTQEVNTLTPHDTQGGFTEQSKLIDVTQDQNFPHELRGPTLALKLDDGTIVYARDTRLHSQVLEQAGVDPSRVVDSGLYRGNGEFESHAPDTVEIHPENAKPQVPPAETPGRMVGLSKDYISEDRAARGEEPLAQQARIGNEETWDKSEPVFASNPNAGHDLVRELTANPRAATPDDLGVLLRHRVNLANETDLFSEKALKPDVPAPEKAEALQRLAALQDARNDADVVTRSMGATAGRSLQFLKQLSDQDYSLSSMLQERRVAMGGKSLPADKLESFTKQTEQYSQDLLKADQELQNYTKTQSRAASALQAYKTRLEGATTELERRQAFSDYEPEIRKQLELDPEAIRLKANFERVKNAYQKQLYKDTQANKPLWQKALGFAAYAARESALSGISTLGKLASFTGAKLAEIPMTETAERFWGKVPGFREIAQTSEFGPGANARQLGEFYKEFATTGMKEAWSMLRGKGSATRLALEKEKRIGWPSFFGNLHGVEKTPLLIGSSRMNRLKAMQNEMSKLSSEAIARGEDVSNPLTQGALNYKSFQKATYDILQEQNQFASWVKDGLARMEAVKKSTGEVNATQAVLATLARVFLTKDIIRVPSNYVKQTLERTPLGLARGLGGAARAWYKGVGNVSPAERTAIMKLMGVGSVGSGFFVWGAIDAMKPPDQRTFGGYYQPGEKREKTGDVEFGAIRPFGYHVPHLFTHNPMTESAQMGSTLMRVALSQISKKDLTNRGLVEGVIKSIFGLAEQAPISGQAFRLSKIGEPGGPTSVVGEAIRGLIPQFIQNIAKWSDEGEKRKPRTAVETIKLGIPGLRQQVPEKDEKKKEYKAPSYR